MEGATTVWLVGQTGVKGMSKVAKIESLPYVLCLGSARYSRTTVSDDSIAGRLSTVVSLFLKGGAEST